MRSLDRVGGGATEDAARATDWKSLLGGEKDKKCLGSLTATSCPCYEAYGRLDTDLISFFQPPGS